MNAIMDGHDGPGISKVKLGLFVAAALTLQLAAGHDVYDEDAWRRAGDFLMQHVDRSRKPCENFYDHVCGKYGKERKPGGDLPFRETIGDLANIIKFTVQGLVEKIESPGVEIGENLDEEEEKDEGTIKLENATIAFFRQCVSSQRGQDLQDNLNSAANQTIKQLWLGQSDPQPGDDSNQTRWRLVSRMWRDLGASYLPIDDVHFGYELDTMEAENATIFQIVPSLSDAASNREELAVQRQVTFNVLLSLIPEINWNVYFDTILGAGKARTWLANPDSAVFIVNGPELLRRMGRLINEMDPDQFRDMVQQGVTLFLKFKLIREVNGTREFCLKTLIDRQPTVLAPLYLRSAGSSVPELRDDILTLKRNVFAAFQFLLNSVDWLDEKDTKKVYRKLDEIEFYPGIPDWVEDTERVIKSMNRYTYDPGLPPFYNEIGWLIADQRSKIGSDKLKNQTSEQEEEEEDDTMTFEINAFYLGSLNKITMLLGYMLPPAYEAKYPLAVKYGGVGATIGHELIHAFDANNLATPAVGEKQEWLPQHAWDEFEKRKNCLIKQYSSFCVKDKAYCVSGSKNLGENMGDIDGLKIAYTAFKFAQQVYGADPPIPVMLNYTDDQIFFNTHARFECSRGWDERWTQDVHSPQKARVEVAVRNIPLFARAYGCAVGSTYAPMKTCSVWGDLANPARKRRSTD